MSIPKQYEGIVTEVTPTPDKKAKGPNPWVGIIVHHTSIGDRNPAKIDETLWRKLFRGITGWLTTNDKNYLSAHFHIGRYGECAMLADPDEWITYHAGVSSYYHPIKRAWVSGWNSYAIGIELLGDGNITVYSDEQYKTLSQLCSKLIERYPTIDPRCITGHENIAPARKTDPGKHFDWRRFFSHVYAIINKG